MKGKNVRDNQCLRNLKNQLQDPNNYLSSWIFANLTEGFICEFNGIEFWHPHENRVINIRLSNMGLQGQFPLSLENCTESLAQPSFRNHPF
ncbi:putative inactive leucine-rich repeat receptor-like protein kinase [Cinnamomum micranthum f. kanehirae]|uniref:Putative inactive leucine-rich repeat receptor-like protein kinase n=1 Tax=Cinnamomum micranthum f. kanehirae TaxID=337451 RepID=A0A3S3MPS8_9MAGN|nr:putative inactive leucine-rich repeat receptor-like protein kinase [Cinnamomum micranthum f. kanehirae]